MATTLPAEIVQLASPPLPLNAPFWLDAPESLRLVESGALDIFIQRRGADGHATGARHHVYRAMANRVAPGVDTAGLPEGWGVIAVPLLDTILRTLSCTRLTQACADKRIAQATIALVEQWVRDSLRGMPKNALPQDYIGLSVGDMREVEHDALLSTPKEVAWVSLIAGNACWMGQQDLMLHAQDGACPVTRDMYLQARGKLLLQVIDAAWLASDASLWQSVALHWNLLLRQAVKAVDTQARLKDERLREVLEQSVLLKQHALTRMVKIGAKHGPTQAVEGHNEQLLAAMNVVGERLGVKFLAPSKSEEDFVRRDPVSAVCTASGVRYREVALQGKWWKSDNGPLLARRKDGDKWVALLPGKGHRYELFDPSNAQSQRVTKTLAASLHERGYSFYRSFPNKVFKPFDLVLFALRGVERDVGFVLLCSVLSGLLGLLMPVASGLLVDSIIPSADKSALWQMASALLIAAIATMLLGNAIAIGMLRMETKMNNGMQSAVWDHVLKLPVPFLKRHSTADLALRINAVNTIRQALTDSTLGALLTGFFALFNLIVMFQYSMTYTA